jgi:transcriptional regulator with XRE-family HTH domain
VNTSEENKFLITFGKNLRLIRKSKGFTQENLANDMGIEISQISRIERGIINTSITTVKKISEVLKINPSQLFDI